MSSWSPSYITKTKHGVYYFQLRVSRSLATRLGVKSLVYRKSLKTKDKRLALASARRLWLLVHRYSLEGCTVSGSNNEKFSIAHYEQLIENDVEKSKKIKLAIRYLDMWDAIPDWDEESRQNAIEYRTKEDEEAIQYCDENGINLDDYRSASPVTNIESVVVASKALKNKKMSILLEDYLEAKRLDGIAKSTLKTYKGQLDLLIDMFDISSEELTVEDLDYYKSALSKLPSNRKTRAIYRDKSIAEILDMDIPPSHATSSKTKKDSAQRVRSFLGWAIKRKYIDPDVSVALEGAFMKAESISYAAFDDTDIKKLFDSSEYRNGFSKDSYFWLLLLALFTGARQNELCQILVSDVKEFKYKGETNYYIDINNEDDKSLKTTSSIRKVPLHQVVIDLGFINYVEHQKTKDESIVFNDLLGLSKSPAATVSRWFNESYKASCGIKDEGEHRKVFHSFRHTLINHLYQNHSELPIEKIGDIVGHTQKTVTGQHYVGKGNLSLTNRMDVIKKINYNFDFSSIKKLNLD